MTKVRFELFAGISLAAHVALFAGVRVARHASSSGAGATASSGAAAAVAGDTFEVPELTEVSEEPSANDEAPAVELDDPAANATPPATTGAGPASRLVAGGHPHAKPHGAAAPPPPPPPASYGALGDRSAGDLVKTFSRTFSSAVSPDPVWNSVPVGFYADGEVTFTLAPDGSLVDATPSPGSAPAFRSAIARTTTLLRHRLFTAMGATTRTHMVVRVTDKLVNHGAFTVDAAGAFELPSGRRVTLTVTVK